MPPAPPPPPMPHSHRRHAHGRLRVASSVASADRRAAGHAARTVRVRRVILFSVERANRLLHGEFEPRVANFGGVLAPRVFVQAVVEIRGEIRAGEAPRRDVDVVEVEVEDAAVPELKKLLVLVGGMNRAPPPPPGKMRWPCSLNRALGGWRLYVFHSPLSARSAGGGSRAGLGAWARSARREGARAGRSTGAARHRRVARDPHGGRETRTTRRGRGEGAVPRAPRRGWRASPGEAPGAAVDPEGAFANVGLASVVDVVRRLRGATWVHRGVRGGAWHAVHGGEVRGVGRGGGSVLGVRLGGVSRAVQLFGVVEHDLEVVGIVGVADVRLVQGDVEVVVAVVVGVRGGGGGGGGGGTSTVAGTALGILDPAGFGGGAAGIGIASSSSSP